MLQENSLPDDVLLLPMPDHRGLESRVRLGCGAVAVVAASLFIYYEMVRTFSPRHLHDPFYLVLIVAGIVVHYLVSGWLAQRGGAQKQAERLARLHNRVWQLDNAEVQSMFGALAIPLDKITGYGFGKVNPKYGSRSLIVFSTVPKSYFQKFRMPYDMSKVSEDKIRGWMERHGVPERDEVFPYK